MKTSQLSIIASLVLSLPLFAGDLIPYKDFYVSVETNDWFARRDEGDRLNVSVSISRSADKPNGSSSIRVYCYTFESWQRMLTDDDIEAFLAAGDAAQEGEEFRHVVTTETFRGDQETIYEVVNVGGEKLVRMSRGVEQAEFVPAEAAKVRAALAQARSAEAWYKKLLLDEVLPEPNDEARPPRSSSYNLISTIGTVSGKGLGYEVAATSFSSEGDPEYRIEHELCLYSEEGEETGSLSGDWVADLLKEISIALDATVNGRAYSFQSNEVAGSSYSVTVNLATMEADVELQPGNFFNNREASRGHFGKAQLADIRKLISDYENRAKWFQANERLFYTKN
ncbi:hypothetical protein [Persicirhabdus sediminis]|uniref:Uncharacterized protein n=1 Tax=Persicirhabdus sediminis TaxID=454144 RepID=A0A8J7ME41_9BACT|nr:hypothetical protein [Persicirhabdus sediminis]MBK1791002.1 hypothetical protein [Persicirhabdus sediminis]